MSTQTFTLRGDQLGTFGSTSFTGNGDAAVLSLSTVSAYGGASDRFTLVIEQINSGADATANGQFATIYDAANNVVMSRIGLRPDEYQGRAMGDEHLVISSAHFVIDLNGLPATPTRLSYDVSSLAGDPLIGDNDGKLDFTDIRSDFPCFAKDTLIRVPGGECLIQDLRDGDLVESRDQGALPIRWIRSRSVAVSTVQGNAPVRVWTEAEDLIVSGQHGVLMDLAGREVLVPAKAMVGSPDAEEAAELTQVDYYSILLPRHALIWANGRLCESFYPGPWILKAIAAPLRAELVALLPGLDRAEAAIIYGPTCRPRLSVGQARKDLATYRASMPSGAVSAVHFSTQKV